jgi:SAM-dependent methyltransferase
MHPQVSIGSLSPSIWVTLHAGEAMSNDNWIQTGALQKRVYATYEEYATHQAAKLGTLNLKNYEKQFSAALRERIKYLEPIIGGGKNVLCLGARTGIECAVFIEMGCFSVGIDLNPGEKNKYVVTGDFHALQFADRSVDAIYCNALDHAFELPKILNEVRRVLKSNGIFIAEIVDPTVRGPGEYEALWWDNTDSIVSIIQEHGLGLWNHSQFEYPWKGLHAVFVNKNRDKD